MRCAALVEALRSPTLHPQAPIGKGRALRRALAVLALAFAPPANALTVAKTDARPPPVPQIEVPDRLPHSVAALGSADIAVAWLAAPTPRYAHGVLGDALEASRLAARTRSGATLRLELPPERVFEDLAPRLADLDGDGRDEIIVVEADAALGARLSVYGVAGDRIVLRAAGEFIGRPQRWLNPVGVGDFDGDGRPDVAVLVTPHIDGVLRLYRWGEGILVPFAEHRGVTNHEVGSTELGLGVVAPARPRDRLLLPVQDRRALVLLEWSEGGVVEVARAPLAAPLAGSLIPVGKGRWRTRLADGRHVDVSVP